MVTQEFTQKPYPEVVSGIDMYRMLKSAAKELEKYIDLLNDINVFPVPDGDTGINMHQTFKSIINELASLKFYDHCGKIISAAAKGAFFGSIGNSGIILAEYFHGLTQEWKNSKTINTNLFAKGLFSGARYAYKAVENPREGTILTVVRIMAETANEWKAVKNPFELLFIVFEEAKVALLDTHRSLPEANIAGVVDAGASGLVLIFEGFIKAVIDRFPSRTLSTFHTIDDDLSPFLRPKIGLSMIKPEFEVILKISGLNKPLDFFKIELRKEGSCLLIISNDSLSEIKVHIHCTNPDKFISKVKEYVSHVKVVSIQSLNEQYVELANRIGRD